MSIVACFLARLIGSDCWDAIYANAEVLQLEFGDHVTRSSLRGRTIEVGSQGLSVWCRWHVLTTSADLIDSEDPQVYDALELLKSRLTALVVSSASDELRLNFESGASLVVCPLPGARPEDELVEYFGEGVVAVLRGDGVTVSASRVSGDA